MVPKSDHLANPRFDKKPSAQGGGDEGGSEEGREGEGEELQRYSGGDCG